MSFFVLGLNYQSAPLPLRERFAFPQDVLPEALLSLRHILQHCGLAHECVILSTCNRTEIYGIADNFDLHKVSEWLLQHRLGHEESYASWKNHIYAFDDLKAIEHIFSVAAGLNSMVLGEPQILGQVKQAVALARTQGTLGSALDQLFQHTFATAKQIRTQTAIGQNSVSMAAATVKLIRAVFGDFKSLSVLFVGAGEMMETIAAHITNMQPAQMVVANRNVERQLKFAKRFAMQTLPLGEMPSHLDQFDVVIASTASPLPIIGLGAVQQALKARKHRPMVMVDLAVPRDIEAQIGALEDVYLYSVDDLADLVADNSEKRKAELDRALEIVRTQAEKFLHAVRQRATVPNLSAFSSKMQNIAQAECARALKMLHTGKPQEQVLQELSYRLLQKYLHAPRQALRSLDEEARAIVLNIFENPPQQLTNIQESNDEK